MKLWELFDEKYIGRKVKYKDLKCKECIARIQSTISGGVALFPDDSSRAIGFSQFEMQDYDFEFENEPLTFNELTKVDVYSKTIKVEIGNDCHIGIFSDILENFSRENCSHDCMKLFTEGKWYIMD